MNVTRSPKVRSTERAGAKVHAGIEARKRAPRRGAAVRGARIRDRRALDRLRAQEAVRDPELLPLRYARTVSSPWAYHRGGIAAMAADLACAPHSGLTVQMYPIKRVDEGPDQDQRIRAYEQVYDTYLEVAKRAW